MNSSRVLAVFLISFAAAQQEENPPVALPAPEPLILQGVEDKYSAEVARAKALVTRAEADLAKARKLAGDARLKAYKARLSAVTKAGDFDKAIAVKARVTQLESEPEMELPKQSKRPRPKETTKFGGHTYALISEAATWHVAKQRCEEMGGHLAILESPSAFEFASSICDKSSFRSVWLGATDELVEGEWKWVDGTSAKFESPHIGNSNGGEHYLSILVGKGLNDDGCSRNAYLCEWDK